MAEMTEAESLKNALAANRRSLQLLDTYIEQLKSILDDGDEAYDELDGDPYFYGALGQDGENGIPLGFDDTTLPSVGLIQIQNDAPFVWTHVMACQRYTNVPAAQVVLTPSVMGFTSVWGPSAINVQLQMPNVNFSIVEEGSGRVLFGAQRLNTTSLMPQAEHFLQPATFESAGLFYAFPGESTCEWSGGHGPQTVMALPRRVTLPVNDVLTIRAQPLRVVNADAGVQNNYEARMYITLLGYKVRV